MSDKKNRQHPLENGNTHTHIDTAKVDLNIIYKNQSVLVKSMQH